MRAGTREKLRWMAIGTAYAWLFPFGFMVFLFRLLVADAAATATVAALIGGPLMSGFFLFVVPATRRLPFAAAVFAQLATFAVIMAPVFFLGIAVPFSLKNRVAPWSADVAQGTFEIMRSPALVQAYLYTFVALLGTSAVYQVSRKLGPGVLGSWLLGRYHRPREEEFVFMFLDMKDSTALAESLGNLKFSALMQEFFSDLSEPLGRTKGRVSHYIGDEAVIYWRPADAFRRANCLRFAWLFSDAISERSAFYQDRFGVVPAFKAGLHVGRVVAAEVGDHKSEIVFHGDVLNTTARIVGLCGSLGRDLLLSKALADRLTPLPDGIALEDVGSHALKGKAEPVEIHAARFASIDAGLR